MRIVAERTLHLAHGLYGMHGKPSPRELPRDGVLRFPYLFADAIKSYGVVAPTLR